MPKIVTLWHDPDIEDPSTFNGSWKLYSFNRRHRSHENRSEFFDDEGRPNIGLRRKLGVGLALVLDYYEHSGCAWSLSGRGMQCQWDTARMAGLLVWEHKPKEIGAKTREDRAKDAEGFLEVYNAWCNGQGYGYTIEERVLMPCGHTEIKDVDSCGGFYGNDLAHMKGEIIAALDGETEIEVKGEARDLFSASDLQPKVAPETHATH